MEPDLPLFPRSPTGLQRTHARDHSMGPAQSPGGGKWIPGRGARRMLSIYYFYTALEQIELLSLNCDFNYKYT